MPHVTVGSEGADPIEIYYEDHGAGRPVVLSHGYPLSGQAWEKQVSALVAAGYRAITYDRRGWGNSSQPDGGYDVDTFADDLNALLTQLDVRDAILVGHSMGTGDVARYLGRHGTDRVAKAVLMSPIPPFLLKTDDNPEGAPQSLFDGFVQAARADRNGWLKQFLENFYNVDVYGGSLVSEEAFQASVNVAVAGSPVAAVACIPTWLTDFRADLPKIDVPVLVIQGDEDRVLPIGVTGQRLSAFIADSRLLVIEGGPHAIAWTHSDQVNAALLDFCAK
ncbi:alpha/beta hydrolase [Micromonospora sp. NPDC047644]|uniref:alpha/beta fold hydrolase n=1 Tax=Micromonospora sp. NPDC047644 TaxID=3157203 RepID=UPI003456E564